MSASKKLKLSAGSFFYNDCDFSKKLSPSENAIYQDHMETIYGGDSSEANCRRRDIMNNAGIFEFRKQDINRAFAESIFDAIGERVAVNYVGDSVRDKKTLKKLAASRGLTESEVVAMYAAAKKAFDGEKRAARVSLDSISDAASAGDYEDMLIEAIDIRSRPCAEVRSLPVSRRRPAMTA